MLQNYRGHISKKTKQKLLIVALRNTFHHTFFLAFLFQFVLLIHKVFREKAGFLHDY